MTIVLQLLVSIQILSIGVVNGTTASISVSISYEDVIYPEKEIELKENPVQVEHF